MTLSAQHRKAAANAGGGFPEWDGSWNNKLYECFGEELVRRIVQIKVQPKPCQNSGSKTVLHMSYDWEILGGAGQFPMAKEAAVISLEDIILMGTYEGHHPYQCLAKQKKS